MYVGEYPCSGKHRYSNKECMNLAANSRTWPVTLCLPSKERPSLLSVTLHQPNDGPSAAAAARDGHFCGVPRQGTWGKASMRPAWIANQGCTNEIDEANVARSYCRTLGREFAGSSPGGASARSSWRSSWSGCRSTGVRSSDLDWYNTAEGAGRVGVGHLHEAYSLHVADGASAGSTSRNSEGNREVHVDIGGTPRDHPGTFQNITYEGLLGDGSRTVAVGSRNVLCRLEKGALAELTSRSRV